MARATRALRAAGGIARKVLADLAPVAHARGSDVELARRRRSQCAAMPALLHVLLRNLVDNALRYGASNSPCASRSRATRRTRCCACSTRDPASRRRNFARARSLLPRTRHRRAGRRARPRDRRAHRGAARRRARTRRQTRRTRARSDGALADRQLRVRSARHTPDEFARPLSIRFAPLSIGLALRVQRVELLLEPHRRVPAWRCAGVLERRSVAEHSWRPGGAPRQRR